MAMITEEQTLWHGNRYFYQLYAHFRPIRAIHASDISKIYLSNDD